EVFAVKGDGAFSVFKWEGGTNRVQRVPATESQGRIHTSTATVAVMPEAEDVEIQIEDKDLKIDVYRSTGPGGQSVNTTDSAVRITHLPTGIVVSMQDEKSQLQNKQKAMRVLRARLYEAERERQQAEVAAARRSQVGTGERAEKIRTYNFPENRLTDHRVKHTVHRLDQILDGDLEEFTETLPAVDRPSRGTGLRAAAPRSRAAPRARARARARRAVHAPRPAAVGRRARRRARARPAQGGRRAAPVRPRRVGLPAPHAPRRRARAHPTPRDRDPRRALPHAARGGRGPTRPRRRRRIGRCGARARRRAPRRTGDRDGRVRGGPLARAGERGAHGPRGRARVPRPLRRLAGRRLGPRRLQ